MRALVMLLGSSLLVCGSPQAMADEDRAMAMRDTLEYSRTFDVMPSDWRDRPDPHNGSAGEFGSIHPSMSWTYDGSLVVATKADPDQDGHYLVGQVETTEPFSSVYGFWEARLRFPTAPGVLAGWWLQADPAYATDKHVEIDIAENTGNPNIWHTLWYRPSGAPWGTFVKVPDPALVTDLGLGSDEPQADLHNYGMRVTPTGYTWFVDSVKVGSVNRPVVDVPVRMVFSIKVPDYLVSDLDPDNLAGNRLKVAWVRKYAP